MSDRPILSVKLPPKVEADMLHAGRIAAAGNLLYDMGQITAEQRMGLFKALAPAFRPLIDELAAQVGRSGEAIDPATQIAGSTEGEHAVAACADAPNPPPETHPHD